MQCASIQSQQIMKSLKRSFKKITNYVTPSFLGKNTKYVALSFF